MVSMAKVTVHAGDFIPTRGDATFGSFVLKTDAHPFAGEAVRFEEIAEIDVASEDSVKRIGGTVGWGAAGLVILGPVGLLAGLLMGGRKKDVTFVAKFNDGRRLLATTDSKTYTKVLAATF